MNLWKTAFRLTGYTIVNKVNLPAKCVICVAPHTSNMDFILGILAYKSMGREANFLMKKFWFFFPLKYLLRKLGGIPVERKKGKGRSLTSEVISQFKERHYMNLAVTPEGTRSRTSEWRTGFLAIARGAGVPVVLATIDFSNKKIEFLSIYEPGESIESDLAKIKEFYSEFASNAKYPEKFTT